MAAVESTNGSVLTNGASLNGDAAGETGAAITQAQPISAGKQTGSPNVGQPLTTVASDEIALYDRQIRLWGVKAQERLVIYCPLLRFMSLQADVWFFRLRTANILLITLKALANEVAKNLVLAGIGSLTISDDQFVTEDDVCSQFFVSEEHVGMNVCYQGLLSILHN